MDKRIVIKNSRNISDFIQHVDEDFILISITDPELNFVDIPENKNCRGILRLKFHDVVKKQKGKKSFRKRHGNLIKNFITDNDTRLIICQCKSGISRSPAIGAAIAKLYGLDTKPFFTTGVYVPNLLVFKRLLNEFKIKNVDFEIERHKQMWIQSIR